MDSRVTEVTEMSGRGREVTEICGIYGEVYGGYEDMRGLWRLRWWCGNAK